MIVLKFGGASLADAKNFENVKEYIKNIEDKKPVVVVSAMKGITDMLIDSIDSAVKKREGEFKRNLEVIEVKHREVIDLLVPEDKKALEYLKKSIDELNQIYISLSVIMECSPKTYDRLVSYGEKLSSFLLSCFLQKNGIESEQITGEELILTDSNHNYAYPDLNKTEKKTRKRLLPVLDSGKVPVVTGFIGADEKGNITTLGRGGSDFTASILAYCLDADEVWFLKGVSGIMTADPEVVVSANTIKEISYDEVAELSYFGAKVFHPIAIHPLRKKEIPSFIKNVYEFDDPGTRVIKENRKNGTTVKAITYIKNTSIVSVEGKGMLTIPQIAGRVFSCLGDLNILMISQSSSEQNICFVVRKDDAVKAIRRLKTEFELELIKNQINSINSENSLAVLSVVGSGMQKTPGVSGKVFKALGDEDINIKLIVQGSSELNISFVVDSSFLKKSVNAIHERFALGV
ncbi:aspartate kinase [Candidatus Woesearchaeota archaeon]|nr:aspartate kinase [Candidatus Woesearchaeota archaeon]